MTFLTPVLLALGAVAVVPLALHLLHRHRAPRILFPAVRYLRRAEREHATRIRLRQLLLLALRVGGVVLLAGAAARPFVDRDAGSHPPTAVVIVLDNSLSSGAVVEDRRVLDGLKEAARITLDNAGPDDVFWLLRAGAPWEPAIRGTAAEVRGAVEATGPSDAGVDLGAVLKRARTILAGAGPATREIHLLSDLQATGFRGDPGSGPSGGGAADAPPIRVLALTSPPPRNRAVTRVEVGGGLPPRAGERSTLAASIAGTGDSVAVRLIVDGTVRGVIRAPVDAAVVLPFPAWPAGRVTGHVEIDRDALAADDRRWFVVEVAPPPVVASVPLPFLEEALAVLADARRIRRVPATAGNGADVMVAPAAAGAGAVGAGAGVLVLPPASPLERTAANRRLADAGIPWRFEPPIEGEARLDTTGLDLGVLGGVRLRQVYGLNHVAGPGEDTVLIRLATGEPWAVGGIDGHRRSVLLATPLTPTAGTIPTSAALLPLLERVLAWLAPPQRSGSHAPGELVTVTGDAVVTPDGSVDTVAAGAPYRATVAGIYRVMAGDEETAAFAVNPPAAESELARSAPADVPGEVLAAAVDGWPEVIYHRRLGGELTVALLVIALSVLVLESAVAATGRA